MADAVSRLHEHNGLARLYSLGVTQSCQSCEVGLTAVYCVSFISDDWANASLGVEVCLLRGLTFAESTKMTYRTQRESYLAFCHITGSCPVPASVETVCRYAALRVFSSVRQYLNIIRLLHLEAREINPLDCYLVQSMLKGLRRQLGYRVIRSYLFLQLFY